MTKALSKLVLKKVSRCTELILNFRSSHVRFVQNKESIKD